MKLSQHKPEANSKIYEVNLRITTKNAETYMVKKSVKKLKSYIRKQYTHI